MPTRRPQYQPFNGINIGTQAADNVFPILSSPDNGTETSDGTTNFGVTTTKSHGGIYWAVTTNNGSATVEEIVNGAGGNIVAGKAGRQAVTSAGAVTIAAITGLTAATDYEIFFVHVDGVGNRSASATVGLTTTA